MRIALIIERMDPSRGGRELSTAQIAEELTRRGHEVTILCQSGEYSAPGVQLRVLPSRAVGRTARLRRFVRDAQRSIETEAFDISHAMLPVSGVTVVQLRGGTRPGNLAARQRRTRGLGKAVAKLGDTFNEHRRLLARLEREVIASPTLLLPNSEMVAREIDQHYGRSRGVIVVPNGVAVPDVSAQQRAQWRRDGRETLGLGAEDVVFLTIATNFRLKGVDFATRAFAQAFAGDNAPKAHFLILGQAEAPAVTRLAERLGLADHIHLLPPTPEVFRWYSTADVCVLLSWYDACSRVVLEATRWGIPSITTTYNGAAESLTGGAGIVVERPDALDDVAAAMRSLADPEQRARRAKACDVVAEELTIERHVDRLLTAYGKK